LSLLREADVQLVADVRTLPRSRASPQFNRGALEQMLAAGGIDYAYLAALGGRRSRQREVSPVVNAFWHNDGFHNYADYAMSESFRTGLAQLTELGHARTCAVMCAEAVWWRCHRRIIADYLLAAHEPVFHILGPHHIVPAQMTPAAKRDASGALTYPAAAA
jgi:uncharacterized protein (DUF488 family)